MSIGRPHLLIGPPDLTSAERGAVVHDYEQFAREGLPVRWEEYLRDRYALDVAGRYAGFLIKNPWGKASGQLTMRTAQVEDAARSGLGFAVLKTVIAQDARGAQSMGAWAIKESRMDVERIVGRESGETGWTVTWKGRGWWQSFDEYLQLTRESVRIGREQGMIVVPSVKYHLPGPEEDGWRIEEYRETTRAILAAYREGAGTEPMPIEKDFSPTLAGAERSRQRSLILEWLTRVPTLIREAVAPDSIRIGLKLFNSREDDAFQLEMLDTVHQGERADFLVYANRLFDPDREFDGCRGVAYGGPDLSDRNLRVLSAYRATRPAQDPLEISATGDILTGRMAIEYALRGCTSFQMHTLFQLPSEEFAMRRGGKIERVLHHLVFHPETGLIVWMKHVGRRLGIGLASEIRLLDIAAAGTLRGLEPRDLDPQLAERGDQ